MSTVLLVNALERERTHDKRAPQVPVAQDSIVRSRVQHLHDLVPDRSQVTHLVAYAQARSAKRANGRAPKRNARSSPTQARRACRSPCTCTSGTFSLPGRSNPGDAHPEMRVGSGRDRGGTEGAPRLRLDAAKGRLALRPAPYRRLPARCTPDTTLERRAGRAALALVVGRRGGHMVRGEEALRAGRDEVVCLIVADVCCDLVLPRSHIGRCAARVCGSERAESDEERDEVGRCAGDAAKAGAAKVGVAARSCARQTRSELRTSELCGTNLCSPSCRRRRDPRSLPPTSSRSSSCRVV